MAISMRRAKALCTANELELIKTSTRQGISKLSAARLRQKETRARKLRDKWRDQAAGQKRSAQSMAGSRAAGANKNSAEKAQLFDEVLGRFTAQLAKVEAAGETPGPMGRRRSSRSARSTSHRAARSEVRGKLAEKKRALKSEAKRSSAKAAAEASDGEAESAAEMPKQGKAKQSRPPIGTHVSALDAGQKVQGLHVTRQQQLSARTAAKKDRLKASGKIRVQTNRSAANKRKQAKRDAR
jgi:hypothetical protein